MPDTPCLAPADRARALCAALGLDGPAAREAVAAAMREAEREALERACKAVCGGCREEWPVVGVWDIRSGSGPGHLGWRDAHDDMRCKAAAIRVLMEESRNG